MEERVLVAQVARLELLYLGEVKFPQILKVKEG